VIISTEYEKRTARYTKNEKGLLSSNTKWDRYHHHHSVYGKNNMYMQTSGFSLMYRQPLHL
jgi:hypothetical protein